MLLYVSDWYTDDVLVYNYNTGELLGAITGLNVPYGQCVNANGDVWIAELDGASVIEYPRGGTRPLKILITNGRPIGCAVASNGDLAVANLDTWNGSDYEAGNIQVFKKASRVAQQYECSNSFFYYPPGYDNKGNLYVQTTTNAGTNGVCELPSNARSLRSVNVNAHIYFGGSVMWDGRYITLTDLEYSGGSTTAIYQAAETSTAAAYGNLEIVGATDLNDNCRGDYVNIIQPFIVGNRNTPVNHTQGDTVVGGNLWCNARVDYWRYPSGGYPIKELFSAPQQPEGQSVSIK